MTSVNTFRWLLTHLTGAQFELLENRSYRADSRQPDLFRQFGGGGDTLSDDPISAASSQQ